MAGVVGGIARSATSLADIGADCLATAARPLQKNSVEINAEHDCF